MSEIEALRSKLLEMAEGWERLSESEFHTVRNIRRPSVDEPGIRALDRGACIRAAAASEVRALLERLCRRTEPSAELEQCFNNARAMMAQSLRAETELFVRDPTEESLLRLQREAGRMLQGLRVIQDVWAEPRKEAR